MSSVVKEPQLLAPETPNNVDDDHDDDDDSSSSDSSTVDASRPFNSVKEGVAIFGERRLFARDIDHQSPPKPTPTPKPKPPLKETSNKLAATPAAASTLPNPKISHENNDNHQEVGGGGERVNNVMHGNDLVMMLMILKKLESELQETKKEVKLLKERESETEVALASLTAQLHINMSKIAKAEAAEAAAAATRRSSLPSLELSSLRANNNNANNNAATTRTTTSSSSVDVMAAATVKNVDSPTLAQILSITDYDDDFGYLKQSKKKVKQQSMKKKKPIVPLVTDLFPWKKRLSPRTDQLSGPLFSSHLYFA